jgi:hypothetical protein
MTSLPNHTSFSWGDGSLEFFGSQSWAYNMVGQGGRPLAASPRFAGKRAALGAPFSNVQPFGKGWKIFQLMIRTNCAELTLFLSKSPIFEHGHIATAESSGQIDAVFRIPGVPVR